LGIGGEIYLHQLLKKNLSLSGFIVLELCAVDSEKVITASSSASQDPVIGRIYWFFQFTFFKLLEMPEAGPGLIPPAPS